MRRLIRVLLLIVSAGVVVSATGLTFSYQTAQYTAALGETTRAQIRLGLSDQATVIRPVTDPSLLFEASLDYVGQVTFEAHVGATSVITLKEDSQHKYYAGIADLAWRVGLSPQVPLTLALDGGAGDLTADLSALQLSSLDVELGAGDTVISLPPSAERLSLRLATGAGDVLLRIPDGLALAFNPLQIGRGEVVFKVGQGVDFETQVELTAGRLILDVPDDAAVRVFVESAARGQFKREMPIARVRAGWSPETGAWQTDGFGEASAHIVLTVRLSGGELILR